VKTIRDVQKEEAFISSDIKADAKQRREQASLKRSEEIDEEVTQHEQEQHRFKLRVVRLTWVWMWVLRRLGYVWVGGGWEGGRMVELEEEDENIMTD
jgi:hypothetical protein